MINLNEILQQAQGGQAIDKLAARFGLPPDQARSAVEALLPALQMGLQNKVAAGGLGSLLGAATATRTDPDDASSPAVEQQGRSVLRDLFGGAGPIASVAQQVAMKSGVPASIVQAMLPMITSLLMGELLRRAGGGGLGGILSSALGSLLGENAPGSEARGAPPSSGPPSSGGLGGAIGDILGGFLGGGSHPVSRTEPTPKAPPIDDEAPTPAGNAALDEISDMFTAGTPPAPEHEAALASIVRR